MKSAILSLLLACLPGAASAAEAVTIVMPEQAVLKPVADLPAAREALIRETGNGPTATTPVRH